jgi:hypothetical protein
VGPPNVLVPEVVVAPLPLEHANNPKAHRTAAYWIFDLILVSTESKGALPGSQLAPYDLLTRSQGAKAPFVGRRCFPRRCLA